MKIQIKSKYDDSVIFQGKFIDIKQAVETAVKNKVNLSGAYLSWANLSDANLRWANLTGVDLSGANLSRTDLSGANLSWANLDGANLSRANLYGANLSGADLIRANLENVKNMPCFQIVPEIGPFYAFKKLEGSVIATLYVPRSAGRVNSTGRKCRVSKAKVVALSKGTEAYDKHTGKLLYKLGQWVKPDSFDSDIREECTNGIHCFITKGEAENY